MKTKEDIVNNWLPRYTGRTLESFGKYFLLTNFLYYVDLHLKIGIDALREIKANAISVKHLRF
jgi:AMP nucleosidase